MSTQTFLVLYESDNKETAKKYVVKQGVNTVGSHSFCEIQVDNPNIPSQATIIKNENGKCTIQRICKGVRMIMNVRGGSGSGIPMKDNIEYQFKEGSVFQIGKLEGYLERIEKGGSGGMKEVESKGSKSEEGNYQHPSQSSQHPQNTQHSNPKLEQSISLRVSKKEKTQFTGTLKIDADDDEDSLTQKLEDSEQEVDIFDVMEKQFKNPNSPSSPQHQQIHYQHFSINVHPVAEPIQDNTLTLLQTLTIQPVIVPSNHPSQPVAIPLTVSNQSSGMPETLQNSIVMVATLPNSYVPPMAATLQEEDFDELNQNRVDEVDQNEPVQPNQMVATLQDYDQIMQVQQLKDDVDQDQQEKLVEDNGMTSTKESKALMTTSFPETISQSVKIKKSSSYDQLLFSFKTEQVNQSNDLVQRQNRATFPKENKKGLEEQDMKQKNEVKIMRRNNLLCFVTKTEEIDKKEEKPKLIIKQHDQYKKPEPKYKPVVVSGFSCTMEDKQKLGKLGMRIIQSPTDKYEALIIDEDNPKVCPRLLQSLILNTEIIGSSIFKRKKSIKTKLYGMTWKEVIEIKGREKLFQGHKLFLSNRVFSKQYNRIVELAGGEVLTSLQESQPPIVFYLSEGDLGIYQKFKGKKCKNRFYSNQHLLESIITNTFPLKQQINSKFFRSLTEEQ